MQYIHRFRIGNLSYTIKTDSLRLKTFFLRAYSLFDNSILASKLPSKNIVIKVKTGDKKDIYDIVLDANTAVFKHLIDNLRKKALFLHASCIIFEDKCLFFLGNSLQGKSTIVAMLRDRGGIVLSDDSIIIEYKSNRVLRFPTFASVRRGALTVLQKKYLKPVFRKFKEVNSEKVLSDMPDKEFKAYYLYNRALYSGGRDVNGGFKKIAIVLKKNKSGFGGRLERIDFPGSLNAFINSLLYTPKHILKRDIRWLLNISSNMDFYTLESASAKEALKLISRIL